MKINLGSGIRPMEGYINVDHDPTKNPEVVWDLEKLPLPFKDNSATEIQAQRVIEHLHETMPIVKDMIRILKPGGIMEIRVPHYLSIVAWTDITHYRSFSGQSFDKLNLAPECWNLPLKKISTRYSTYRGLNWLLNIDRRITEWVFAKFIPIFEIIFILEVQEKC